MNNLIRKYLDYVRKFYRIIENNCDLYLSVTDKSKLLTHLKKVNHEGLFPLVNGI